MKKLMGNIGVFVLVVGLLFGGYVTIKWAQNKENTNNTVDCCPKCKCSTNACKCASNGQNLPKTTTAPSKSTKPAPKTTRHTK